MSVGHTLIVKDATFDTAGAYTCVVTVPEIDGMDEMETLRVTVKGQSVCYLHQRSSLVYNCFECYFNLDIETELGVGVEL